MPRKRASTRFFQRDIRLPMIQMSMRPAPIRTIRARSSDIPIEKLSHGGCAHQAVERLRREFTILIVNALDADDQMASGPVVTDTLNEAAPVNVPAFERLEIDGAAIPHVDRFGANLGGEQVQEQCYRGSDHGIRQDIANPSAAEIRRHHTSLDSAAMSR
jgi:hypothetical protein